MAGSTNVSAKISDGKVLTCTAMRVTAVIGSSGAGLASPEFLVQRRQTAKSSSPSKSSTSRSTRSTSAAMTHNEGYRVERTARPAQLKARVSQRILDAREHPGRWLEAGQRRRLRRAP